MSDSESTDADRDGEAEAEATTSGDEGFQVLVESAQAQTADRERQLTAAEKQKRRIMRDRGEVDQSAPPVDVTFDGWEIAFSPLPKKIRVWMENAVFDFAGVNEDSLQSDPERGSEMREVKNRTISILAEHSRAATYDAEFWSEWVGVEERMGLINDILDKQDAREGNRR